MDQNTTTANPLTETLTVYRVANDDSRGGFVTANLGEAVDFLRADAEHADDGDCYRLHIETMGREAYESLPEFDGF